MSVATPPNRVSSPGPQRPFTVDEYPRMILAAVLDENDPVELLEGWIVFKMPHDPIHDATVDRVQEALRRRLPAGWRVRVQSAITTGDSEPEPDLAVALGPAGRYDARHPGPDDLLLLVEVSGSSLSRDQGEKYRIYARAGLSAYWVINLRDGRVEVYTDPTGPDPVPAYRRHQTFGPQDVLPFAVPGQPAADIPVQELLP